MPHPTPSDVQYFETYRFKAKKTIHNSKSSSLPLYSKVTKNALLIIMRAKNTILEETFHTGGPVIYITYRICDAASLESMMTKCRSSCECDFVHMMETKEWSGSSDLLRGLWRLSPVLAHHGVPFRGILRSILCCNAKRQHLLTCKVSRYRILALCGRVLQSSRLSPISSLIFSSYAVCVVGYCE